MSDIKNEIKEELKTDHEIIISVGLKNPMKSSTFKEIIDNLLFENIGYMSSWGTHTKDEYIGIVDEVIEKNRSLITTIESLQKSAPNLHSLETTARYRQASELAEEQLAEANVQIESLKAITELAVKGLKEISEGGSTGEDARDMRSTADCTLSEIRKLQNG